LAWLVNSLARGGTDMKSGMVVMTGSMIATKFVNPGDRVEFRVEGLGDVRASVG
jgi:2-keto-4-pentenoate hydratase